MRGRKKKRRRRRRNQNLKALQLGGLKRNRST